MSGADRPAVWRIPLALAACNAFGLVSGLLGDGLWDVLSWIALGCPVAVIAWFGMIRPRICSEPR